jgi:enoyl-CoA hydratase/carnithine racemase
MYRLLTFPLVTIAAINGHGTFMLYRPATCAKLLPAFAGGMILALACDFRLITSGKGLMSMNEVKPSPVL